MYEAELAMQPRHGSKGRIVACSNGSAISIPWTLVQIGRLKLNGEEHEETLMAAVNWASRGQVADARIARGAPCSW